MASLSMASAIAQNATGFVGNGYYRIRNLGTERYIYVTDNKDYTDELHDAEDFQAIQLWRDLSKAVSEPATVLYMKKGGTNLFDLEAQGTGVHQLTGYYVHVVDKGNGVYEVYAKKGSVQKNLSDNEIGNYEQGVIGTNGTGKYMRWVVDQIKTNHATNYFGIKPTVSLSGKYYHPFYAAFPFRTVSPGMHVYYASKISGNVVKFKEISGDIPASTPVIIECASENPADNRLELLTASPASIQDNKLAGVYFCNGKRPVESVDAYKKFDATTMRLLHVADNKLIMSSNADERLSQIKVTDPATHKKVQALCVPANTCYLQATSSTPDLLTVRFEGAGIDEILAENKEDAIEGVYTLNGTQVRTTNDVKGLPAGVYVVGGVKVVTK